MKRIHLILAGQSLIIILLSINRLSSLTTGYVHPNEFLRWVDFNNMVILPLASVLLSYLLKRRMEEDGTQARRGPIAANLVFVAGIYLLGAGYGDHEVTNYLHVRFCLEDPTSTLCRIVIYNDDEFSHLVFFGGFILLNAALMLVQHLVPRTVPASRGDLVLIVVNSLFIAAGIFANLAFEEIGLDLYVVALLSILSLYLLLGWRRPIARIPIILYFAVAFTLSTAATFLVKAFDMA